MPPARGPSRPTARRCSPTHADRWARRWPTCRSTSWAGRRGWCSWDWSPSTSWSWPDARLPTASAPRLGFGLVLAVAAGMIHKFAPGIRPSPPVGSGGYTGALVATFLFSHFGPYGMLLIMVSAGAFGLVLCLDVLFTWPVREFSTWVRCRLDRRRADKDRGCGRARASCFPPLRARRSRRCRLCPI